MSENRPKGNTAAPSNGRHPLTLDRLSGKCGLPFDFLRAQGLEDLPTGISIPYRGAAGEDAPVAILTNYLRPSEWPLRTPPRLYGEWELPALVTSSKGFLFIVLGELPRLAARFHGLPVVAVHDARSCDCLDRWHLEGVGRIYANRTPNGEGDLFIDNLRGRLDQLGFAGHAYEFHPCGFGDLAGLHKEHPDRFLDLLHDALVSSSPLGEGRTRSPQPAGEQGNEEAAALATTCLDAIRPEPVRWFAEGRIPLGKLILTAGDGGQGKSTLWLDAAAKATRGLPCFGLAYDPLPASDVLLISCEDDYADTIVPRLLAAGADLSRVHRVDGVRGKDGKPLPFCLAHYEELERELKARPDVRLVVIDPAGAYVGRSGIDDHKDSELRTLLGPLAELAARCRVTIVLIKHLSKGATPKAVHRVGGSVGYVNTVRAAFVVVADKEDDSQKLFLPLKFNIGPKPTGLAYRMVPLSEEEQAQILARFDHLEEEDLQRLGEQLFRVEWLGEVDIDADTALGESAKAGRDPGKVDKAAEWLTALLAEFAYPSEEIFTLGEKEGFTKDNLYKAKDRLGINASNRGSFRGAWHWGQGDPRDWKIRPQPPAGDDGGDSPFAGTVRFPGEQPPDLGP